MTTNTGYEALYQLMGLKLHEAVVGWITSEIVFKGIIVLIFSVSLFLFLIHFISGYLPVFFSPSRAPLGRVVFLIFSLFVGISILKVDAPVGSRDFKGVPWSQNAYVAGHLSDAKESYRVSLLFKLLSGCADEVAKALSILVDKTFAVTNLETQSPGLFFKALLGAAASTITDPRTQTEVNLYTEQCLSKVIPNGRGFTNGAMLDQFFKVGDYDSALSKVELPTEYPGTPQSPKYTCLDLKHSLNSSIDRLAFSDSNILKRFFNGANASVFYKVITPSNARNWYASHVLVNRLHDSNQELLDVDSKAALPGIGGAIVQTLDRAFSVEGLLSLTGNSDMKGVTVASDRAQELSAHLQRGPHVAGFLKLLLVGFFPCLVFFLAAGKWKPLAWWWITYFSICLWNPLWILLYHIITELTLSVDTLAAFGRLEDGVSMYSATLISSRIYQAYAVYAWLQLLVGPTLTGTLLMSMRPLLSDSSRDHTPEGVRAGVQVAGTAAKAVL